MKARICLAILVVLTLAVCSGAWADVVDPLSNVISLTNTNWSDQLLMPMFDTNLGTLTKVELTLFGSAAGTQQFENTGVSAGSWSIDQYAKIQLFKPDTSAWFFVAPTYSNLYNLAAWDGVTDYLGVDSTGLITLSGATAQDTESLTSGLGAWGSPGGVGTVPLNITATGFLGITGGGTINNEILTQGGAYAEVNYYYDTTDIPEPCTLALSSLGLLGIGLLRKRRGKK